MVGAIGLGLLLTSAALAVSGAEGTMELWAGACLKVGVVMLAFWLALPSLTRHDALGTTSVTTLMGVLVAALLVVRTRVPLYLVLPVVGAVVVVLRVLRPRGAASNRPRRDFE